MGSQPYLFAEGLPSTTAEDSQPALQAWVDAAQQVTGVSRLVLPRRRHLRLDAPLVIQHGSASPADPRRELSLDGNGCTLHPTFGGGPAAAAVVVKPRCLRADASTGRGEAQIQIRSLGVAADLEPTARALQWGEPGYQCSAFPWSRLEDVLVDGFSRADAVRIQSARHVALRDVVLRSGAGLQIVNETPGDFCGDLSLSNVELAGSTAVRPLDVIADGATLTEVRGLHLERVTVYGAGARIVTKNAGRVADVTWVGPHFDGPSAAAGEHALELNAFGTASQIMGVELLGPRVTSYLGCALRQIGNGTFRNLAWRGGEVRTVRPQGTLPQAAFVFAAGGGFRLEGVQAWGCEAQALVNVQAAGRPATNWSVDRLSSEAGAIGTGVFVTVAAHDGYRIVGCRGEWSTAVFDGGTGTNKSVGENLTLVS
jgi:hypothetical protein